MTNRRLSILLIFTLLLSAHLQLAQSSPPAEVWANFQAGQVVYAEIINPPDAIYQGRGIENATRLENELYYPEHFRVSALHRYLDIDHIVRVKILEGGQWGEILPDNYYSPFLENPYDDTLTYVALEFLRPIEQADLAPITVFSDTAPADKLILVVTNPMPQMIILEGARVVLRVPIMLGGEVITGDFRVHRTRLSGYVPIQIEIEPEALEETTPPPPDEPLPPRIPDLAGVPHMLFYGDELAIHGSQWWNWAEFGSGGVNPSMTGIHLPDNQWFQAQVGDESVPIDRWLYRWVSGNLDYDETDPTIEESFSGGDTGWYQGVGSVRILVVENLAMLLNYPTPQQLGGGAQVAGWGEIVSAIEGVGENWLIPAAGESEKIPFGMTPAQLNGTSVAEQWVLVDCQDTIRTDQLIYAGSSRTQGQLCDHLVRERQGSICTPERVDMQFLGQRVLCNRRRLERLPLRKMGELMEHESIHLTQFSGVFYDLALAGIEADDPSPGAVDGTQLSSIGVTELMAQTVNLGSDYAADYWFAIVGGDGVAIDYWATTAQAWRHLHRECGDATGGDDAELHALLVAGLMGDRIAYADLTSRCSLPPHRLVPDRSR